MKHQKAQSLIELLIALGVFVLVVSSINFLSLDTYIADRAGGERTQATFLAKEGIEASKSISNNSWGDLSLGNHGISISDEHWVFQGTADDVSDQLTQGARVIIVEQDEICNLNCKKITSQVTWNLTNTRPQTVTLVTYLTNLFSHNWTQTLLADFDLGKRNSVQTTEVGDGEVKLSLVGDWNNASVVANFNTDANGDIRDIFINNNIAYVITMNNGGGGEEEFFVLDISDISNGNINLLGSADLGTELGNDARSFHVSGNYAYIASDDNNAELMVVRLTDYTVVNQYDVPVNVNGLDVFVVDGVAYLTTNVNNSEEFYVLDVSNPEGEITQLNSLEIDATINKIDIVGNYAYLATEGNNKELSVVRLTDNTEVNTFDMAGNGDMTSVQVIGDIAYMGRESSGESEFYTLDITDPEGVITEIDSINLGGDDVETISIYNDLAYLGTDNADKEVVIIDLNTFTETASVDLTGSTYAYAIWFQGAHIYAGTTNNDYEVQVIQSGQGGWENPEIIGSIDLPGNEDAKDVFVLGDYAYIGTKSARDGDNFFIINISDPENPDPRGSLDIGKDIHGLYVSGNYAYLSLHDRSEGLRIVNITNKDNPIKLDYFDAPGDKCFKDVSVLGDYAYIVGKEARNDPEFFVIDVEGPEDLEEEEGSLELDTEAYAIYISGDYAYLATSDNDKELIVVDISDEEEPEIVGSYNADSDANARDIFIENDTAYLVTKENSSAGENPEFYILDITTPTVPSLIGSLDIDDNVDTLVVSGNYAYLGTDENEAGLQIIDISDLANPFLYSTFDVGDDVKGIDFHDGNVYLASKDGDLEAPIIGPGGLPTDYSEWGIFTSSAYDSGATNTSWNNILWTESGTGTLKFQLRTADTEENLSSATWVGSDGTNSTYYTFSEQNIITDPGASGKQWAEYRAFFTGDSTESPVLENITIIYSD